MSESNPEQALTLKTCTYKTRDKVTGEYVSCPDPVVSPEHPFCFKHLRLYSRRTRSGSRYPAVVMPEAVNTHYQEQLTDQAPIDLVPEMAMLRSLLNVCMDNIRKTLDNTGKIQITSSDIANLAELVERVRRVVETQAKINPENSISVEEVYGIIQELVRIIGRNIPAEHDAIRQNIIKDIHTFCEAAIENKALTSNATNK